MKPRISILHPSYKRPVMASQTARNWMLKADHPESIEYILCLFNHDDTLPEYLRLFSNLPVTIIYHSVANMVEQVNLAASKSSGNLLINISDDFDCPHHWDTDLLIKLKGRKDFIVKTKDGIQDFIITLPIMDRVYYERFKHIYHPDFRHMYGDERLAHVGKILNKTITLEMKFPHKHYIVGGMKKDEVNIKNDAYMAQDKDTFKRHKANNFYL